MSEIKKPWVKFFGDIPATLDYFDGTMWEMVEDKVNKYPDSIAYDFMGQKTTYKRFSEKVNICARALKSIGIRNGDRITIALPNCPQAVIAFYAVNMVGAIANMIHPLSSQNEIAFYLKESNSIAAITLDQFYNKFEAIRQEVDLTNIILASIKDELAPAIKPGYMLTEGRKIQKIPDDAPVTRWNALMIQGLHYHWKYKVEKKNDDPAVILYSGGTTGLSKGIVLTNRNFNALAGQIVATNPMFRPGDKMLSVMPMFHGFGLGVNIHSMLANGGRCVLVPRFTPKSYAQLLKRHKCNFIAGVPTLFEAFLRQPSMKKADLSRLKGVFSGGDSLSIELKKKFDKFLFDHNASIQIREGYGTTECVTASCLTPVSMAKEGSIGIPLPDMLYKIVKPGTTEEVPYGEEGEICIAGPTVMVEYLNHPEETAQTLQTHADGEKWIHTGDLGIMDTDGFIFFRQRIKRMIITSGYNVYPSQLENIIEANEMVQISCVIGVPDSYRMQRVKAFVVLKKGYEKSEKNKQILLDHCSKSIAKYAMPREIEFRDELPKTLVGKVAYKELEAEEIEKAKNATINENS